MKHDWELGRFKFVCCRVCLIVQNDKNKDADCKGTSKIVLKSENTEAEIPGPHSAGR